MSTNDRLNKLERAANVPTRTVFFWDDGDGLTPKQKTQVAEAEGRADKVMVFRWCRDDAEVASLGN